MDIALMRKEALDFLESSKSNLHIVGVNEEKREMEVASPDNSFSCFISCPHGDQESWGIWSDKQSCLPAVHLVWEICSLDSVSNVTTLLQALVKAISKTQGGNMKACPDELEDDASEDEDDAIDDEDDYFYGDEEMDCAEESKQYKEQEEEDNLAASFQNSQGSEIAVKRLIKDLRALNSSNTKSGIDASPFESNLFVWHVKLTDIPLETRLGRDLQQYSQKYKEEQPVIHLEMQFPPEYPFSPPFIRVLKPRFQFLTGHVTIGGSICMQMLTKSGWQPTNDIESILVQVRAEILSDPNASLASHQTNVSYSLDEARIAFKRMTQKYGW